MLKTIFQTNLDQIARCDCSSFTTESCNKKGCKTYGNCIGRNPICYVNEPSNCQDLKDSEKHPGKRYSSEACRDIKFRINFNNSWYYKRFQSIWCLDFYKSNSNLYMKWNKKQLWKIIT